MDYLEPIRKYVPYNEQEAQEKEQIFEYKRVTGELLTRDNKIAHMTASSIVFNQKKDKMLMIYHNIWQDWCWTGGHVDGETDFLKVAIKELQEETGVKKVIPITKEIASIDIVPAWGHYKRRKICCASSTYKCYLHIASR